MNTAISITKPPKISLKYVLLFVGVSFALFLLSNFFTVTEVAENTPDLTTEDLGEIAEEIYNAGEISEAVKALAIHSSALAKMISEIERILRKTTDYPGCELYFLEVVKPGYYPVLGYGNQILGYEYMELGDVWKVGQTGNGEQGRYPGQVFYNLKQIDFKLTKDELFYNRISGGEYKKILILEKLFIYSYPHWSGHTDLLKPPGCKIYR